MKTNSHGFDILRRIRIERERLGIERARSAREQVRLTGDPARSATARHGRRRRVRLIQSLTLAAILTAGLLSLAACDRLGQTGDEPAASETEGALRPGSRPTPLPSGPRLASLAVFPQIDEPLEVVTTQPPDGAEGTSVSADEARIVLLFNHPVVPLAAFEDQAGHPVPIAIQPPVSGAGSWLNTSTFVFEPSEDLLPSTLYAVRVDGQLTDVLGATLGQDFEFSFTTANPAVVTTYPEDNTIYAGTSRPITVTFNQAMDPDSAQAAFRLAPKSGEPAVGGAFRWPDGRTLVFTPASALAYDTDYAATVSAGVASAAGTTAMAADYSWSFRTTPMPAVIRTSPADGAKNGRLSSSDFQITFASPMDPEGVMVTIQPTITNQGLWWENDETVAHVYGGWLASAAYTVTIEAGSRSRNGDLLPEDGVVHFTVAPRAPEFSFNTPSRISLYSAYRQPALYARAVNMESATIRLYRVGRGKFLQLTATNPETWDDYAPATDSLIREWSLDTAAPLDVSRWVSTTISTATDGKLSPGSYMIVAPRNKHMLVVSRVNLALKLGVSEALVWATDLDSGAGVPDLPIALYDRRGTSFASGRTDADGVFRASFEARKDPWEAVVATSESDGQVVAAVLSEWQEGIDPWAFDLPYSLYQPGHYANLYTDRPIYRPGQTVYFRGVLRADDDVQYTLPDEKTVRILARDGQGKEILKQVRPLSRFGTFNGELQLSPAAPLGYYNIELSLGPEDEPTFATGQGFGVAAYRKPEFEVAVTTDRESYRPGETIVVDTVADYFFGGPVADATVRWRLLTDDYFFRPDTVSGWWDFVDYDVTEERYYNPQSGVFREGEAVLDSDGHLRLELPAELDEFPLSQVFTIDVEATDLNNQAVSSRASAVVHKGDFYIGLQPQSYVGLAGQEQAVNVISVDTAGLTVTQQVVAVEFFERTWYSVKEKLEDGGFYWTSHFTDTLASRDQVTTGADGQAVARFTPRSGGVYRIAAEATDASGHKIRSATYAWISATRSDTYVNWRQENNDRIALVADKKTYAPGDVAEILIPAPFGGAEALLTVERGRIRKVEHFRLDGNSTTIQLPIESDYAPNVYVSVMLVKGTAADSPLPQFKLGYANLDVSTAEKRIDLTITTAGGDTYKPGDDVTYDVEALDHAGRPVEAEMTLALVDKALLSLASDTAPTLEAAFYGQRMLGVGTSAALAASADRLNEQLAAEKKGGGGGLAAPGTVRRLFRDTAYWNGALVTDRQGRAQVSVTLPDNLTTWNMSVRAVTGADTLVGTAANEIVSTKDVLLRPVIPRFAVVGDRLQLEAVVNNQTAAAVAVQVSLTADGLVVDDDPTKLIDIAAGGKAEVTWQTYVPAAGLLPASVPDAYGAIRLHMNAAGDGHQDAVELDLPVYRMTTPEVVATAGEVDGTTTERIELPANVDPTQGDLTVELNPSLAAASTKSLTWLKSFPYECSEQTVSKFLPNVASYTALKTLDLNRPELEAELTAQVTQELQRLYALQHYDGGWGWWVSDGSQGWLTAYALFGMQAAQEAGFAVDEEAMARAADYLTNLLNESVDAVASWDLNQRTFIAYVLARGGRLSTSRAVRLYDRRDGLSLYGRAFLALALDGVDGDQTSRITTLLADLNGAAQISATGTHWAEADVDYWTMNTNLRTTAIAIMALAKLDPESAHLPNAVRWLMVARRDGHWETTQETAWSVLALTEFMAATGELAGRYSFSVELNDAVLQTGRVGTDNVDQPVTVVAPLDELRPDAGNDLAMNRRGQGRLYYNAALRYYLPAGEIQPLAHGIILGRQYFRVDPGTLKPTSEPATAAAIGDVVQVKLTLIAPTELHYVMVEDPLPAGFEAIDTSLKTSSAAATGPSFEEVWPEGEPELPWWQRQWWSYWVESQLLDQKVALFATELGRGTYEYTYLMRASLAGDFNVMPAHAEEMYFPEVFGRSAGGVFSVTAGQ